MIEIKVNTTKTDGRKQAINITSNAEHKGSYGDFVREMKAVLDVLNEINEDVLGDALSDFLFERVCKKLDEVDEMLSDNEDKSDGE